MIQIGMIRNLVLLDFSIVGDKGERTVIYEIFDMDFSTTFLMTESVEGEKSLKPTEFITTVSLLNSKKPYEDIFEYQKCLPMPFSVATTEGEITKPENLIVIDNPHDIDSERIQKCMDYLNCLKSRKRS